MASYALIAQEKANADSMPAFALTDLSNLFGMVKFYQSARNKGIKPIIGCEVWVSNEVDRNKPVRILLLCQSYVGYLLFCRLLSRAYRENQYRGRAEIKKSWFHRNEDGTDGLIALSGAQLGDIGLALMQEKSCRLRHWQQNGQNYFQIVSILRYKESDA